MKKFKNIEISNKSGHGLALILIIILALFAVYLKNENNKLEQTINNNYSQSFYELIEYVDNVETLLTKAQISSTPEYSAKTLTEIWRESNLAESCLSKIPIKNNSLTNAVKFLNQVSDYSYTLSRETIENQRLSEEQLSNIKMLQENCKTLNETLSQLESEMIVGGISWQELAKEDNNALFAQEVANLSQEGFSNIEKNLQDYEGLIYDGPFSEHMTNPEPKALGTEEYNEEKAREVIYQYISKDAINNLEYNGTVDGNIKAHSFNVKLKNNNTIYINITKLGGKVLWMNYNKQIIEESIDIEEAKKYAKVFLEKHGYPNMKESYYSSQDGVATINFAYTQNGVICYPDLIKVKVALDTGEILGMEAAGYLNSHYDRQIETPKLTAEEARKIINTNINIQSENLAIIPTEWADELLVYEYKGQIDDQNFIIYINANNGKEEDVFLIIDSPNGQLAI